MENISNGEYTMLWWIRKKTERVYLFSVIIICLVWTEIESKTFLSQVERSTHWVNEPDNYILNYHNAFLVCDIVYVPCIV